EKLKSFFEQMSNDVKIVYNRPLSSDGYGEEHPAQEYEIEWNYQNVMAMTTYVNAIEKDGYNIGLVYNFIRDIERDARIEDAKAIFKTINLDPRAQ
ncbi:MAG: hypothetical protein V1816_04520, partial [Pseudomonadota bacterium]